MHVMKIVRRVVANPRPVMQARHGVETVAAFNFLQHSHNISLVDDVLRGAALAIEAIEEAN